jgi:hypothetical protein
MKRELEIAEGPNSSPWVAQMRRDFTEKAQFCGLTMILNDIYAIRNAHRRIPLYVSRRRSVT